MATNGYLNIKNDGTFKLNTDGLICVSDGNPGLCCTCYSPGGSIQSCPSGISSSYVVQLPSGITIDPTYGTTCSCSPIPSSCIVSGIANGNCVFTNSTIKCIGGASEGRSFGCASPLNLFDSNTVLLEQGSVNDEDGINPSGCATWDLLFRVNRTDANFIDVRMTYKKIRAGGNIIDITGVYELYYMDNGAKYFEGHGSGIFQNTTSDCLPHHITVS